MTVRPFDIGTYLVQSRTRADVEHLVDITEKTCSCEAALDFATTSPAMPCAHVEAVILFIHNPKPVARRTGSPFALFSATYPTSMSTTIKNKRAPKKFYIMERHNPQLGVYYTRQGQLSKAAAKRYERTRYGSNHMHAFETEAEMDAALARLKADGESIV